MSHFRYFNPHSREGSDNLDADIEARKNISIHAPVKGATKADEVNQPNTTISIHAPVKGATEDDATLVEAVLFQSTLP